MYIISYIQGLGTCKIAGHQVFRGAWEKDSTPGSLKMALGVRKCGSQTIITNTVQYACMETALAMQICVLYIRL